MPQFRQWFSAMLVIVSLGMLATVGQLARGFRAERDEIARQPSVIGTPADLAARGAESWAIPSPVGIVHGWFIPPRGGATILLAHGTQSDRTSLMYEIHALIARGHGVVAIDFPGLGESTGDVQMTAGRVTAMRAVFDTVVRRRDVDTNRIGLYGFSFGAATVVQFAAEEPRVRAVIAAGAPLDYSDHVRFSYAHNNRLFSEGALLVYRLRGHDLSAMNLTAAARRLAPRSVLVVNGGNDRDVCPTDGERLATLIGPSAQRWLIAGAGHGQYWRVDAHYGERIAQFFSTNLPASPGVMIAAAPH